MTTSPSFAVWLGRFVLGSLLVAWSAMSGFAQSAKPAWQEAIRLVDSSAPADIAAAIAMLQAPETSAAKLPPVGELALAACLIRQRQWEQASAALERYDQAGFKPTSGLRLRMELYIALSTEQGQRAEEAFKNLVRPLVNGNVEALDARATAHAIAAAIAIVEMDSATPRIAPRTLTIGTRCLKESSIRGVSSTFDYAYAQANERAVTIANYLSRIKKEGLEALENEYHQRHAALAVRQAELANQKQLTSEVIRNSREQIDQNTLDLRQLNREISSINQQLRQATPGHPGPKRPAPPPPPPRSSVVVPEYESFDDFDYVVRNGETIRIPIIRTIRRPQVEIDSERDRLYAQLLSAYNSQIEQFRAYEATYNADLKSWTQLDQRRRQELNEKKFEAEATRELLVQANKDIQQEKRDSTKDLRLKRTAEEQEDFELQMLQVALDSHRSDHAAYVFQPMHFDFFNWSHEKTLLQQHVSTTSSR